MTGPASTEKVLEGALAAIAQLSALVDKLQRRIVDLERATGLFATNSDLDSPRGNPTVRFPLKGWRGPDFVGKRYSECSPDFLDALASALQSMAWSPAPGKEKYASGNRADARRARSWARRLRAAAGTAVEAPTEQKSAAPPRTAPRERVPGQRISPRASPAPRRAPAARGRAAAAAATPTSGEDAFSRAVGQTEENVPEGAGPEGDDGDDFLGDPGGADDFLSEERP